MLPLYDLMRRTPKAIQERALKCRTKIRRLVDKEGMRGPYREWTFYSWHYDGTRYMKVRLFPKKRVWVQCSCPHFLYNLEYALARRKASTITYSNGMYPHLTNPKLVPFLCKHLFSAGLIIRAYLRGQLTEERIRRQIRVVKNQRLRIPNAHAPMPKGYRTKNY
jgi:hypothetical protein